MAGFNAEGPDVELKDMGLIEVRFLTTKGREWAFQHHIPNQVEDASLNYSNQKAWHAGEPEGAYWCRCNRHEAEVIEGKANRSGLSVIHDPRMTHHSNLRFINCY